MGSRFYTVVIDSHDPAALARFWAAVLEYQVVYKDPNEVVIAKDENTYPGLIFVPVPEHKGSKNRLHIDLAPDDRDAEVDRICSRGATKIDIGQSSEATWVVLADPEGNEFCVLRTREGGV
jgi:predicted enzyme related to lactoylglutathione lyase